VDAVIGENGAFCFERQQYGGIAEFYAVSNQRRDENRQKLKQLLVSVQKQFPDLHLTRDTLYRQCDIAFDIGQEHLVEREKVREIVSFCRQAGATAKASSIHINVWFGKYDKATSSLAWLGRRGFSSGQALFVGDSPNDEAMFATMQYTAGVANIEPFLPELQHKPRYITTRPGGYGFAELVERLLH
jgi:hydroxymethylpyrimidine pyrophosphatase-like HAD family hydrolase